MATNAPLQPPTAADNNSAEQQQQQQQQAGAPGVAGALPPNGVNAQSQSQTPSQTQTGDVVAPAASAVVGAPGVGPNAANVPQPPMPAEPKLPTRKDTSLKEFLNKMDDYAPIVCFDLLTTHSPLTTLLYPVVVSTY